MSMIGVWCDNCDYKRLIPDAFSERQQGFATAVCMLHSLTFKHSGSLGLIDRYSDYSDLNDLEKHDVDIYLMGYTQGEKSLRLYISRNLQELIDNIA